MNKARAFNPFLCAKTDKLMTLIAEVQTQMSGYEAYYGTRKRARRPADQVTYDRTVEAILCDLCAVELASENDSIHLPLSNKVLRSKSRYKGTALGKTLPDILKVMSAQPCWPTSNQMGIKLPLSEGGSIRSVPSSIMPIKNWRLINVTHFQR